MRFNSSSKSLILESQLCYRSDRKQCNPILSPSYVKVCESTWYPWHIKGRVKILFPIRSHFLPRPPKYPHRNKFRRDNQNTKCMLKPASNSKRPSPYHYNVKTTMSNHFIVGWNFAFAQKAACFLFKRLIFINQMWWSYTAKQSNSSIGDNE